MWLNTQHSVLHTQLSHPIPHNGRKKTQEGALRPPCYLIVSPKSYPTGLEYIDYIYISNLGFELCEFKLKPGRGGRVVLEGGLRKEGGSIEGALREQRKEGRGGGRRREGVSTNEWTSK